MLIKGWPSSSIFDRSVDGRFSFRPCIFTRDYPPVPATYRTPLSPCRFDAPPARYCFNVCSGLVELIEVSVRRPRIESGGREGEFVNGDDSTECFLLFWKKKWKEGEGVISRSGSRRRWLGAMENIFEELDRGLRGKFRIVATFVRCRWRYRAPLQNFSSLLFRSEFNFFTCKFS